MKIYKVTWSDADTGFNVDWCSTKKEAAIILKNAKREESYQFGERQLKDVPSDKKGLIKFLKHETPSNDNG